MTDIEIIDYRDDLAGAFYTINAEWIDAMFVMEPHDRAVLRDPRRHIVDRGGMILFAAVSDLGPDRGIVGTCALMPTPGGGIELTKMGVATAARGRKIGEVLLAAAIVRAQAMGAAPLYLLTSKKCAAAIHLYEKHGFVHDAEILARYGATYGRCDVAMRYMGAGVSG